MRRKSAAALVPQVYSLLGVLRIERPPAGAANTPSIRPVPLRRPARNLEEAHL